MLIFHQKIAWVKSRIISMCEILMHNFGANEQTTNGEIMGGPLLGVSVSMGALSPEWWTMWADLGQA